MGHMLDIANFEVVVNIDASLKSGERTIQFVPRKGLQVEVGFEDPYAVLEGDYGWDRFLREVREQVLEEISKSIKIEVVSADFGEIHEDEGSELRGFFEEFGGEFLE